MEKLQYENSQPRTEDVNLPECFEKANQPISLPQKPIEKDPPESVIKSSDTQIDRKHSQSDDKMSKPTIDVKKPKNKVEQEPEVKENNLDEIEDPECSCNYGIQISNEETSQEVFQHAADLVELRPLRLKLRSNFQGENFQIDRVDIATPRRSVRLIQKQQRKAKEDRSRSRSNLRLLVKRMD